MDEQTQDVLIAALAEAMNALRERVAALEKEVSMRRIGQRRHE